jgi:hypothetical protein
MDMIYDSNHGNLSVSVTFNSDAETFDRVILIADRTVSISGGIGRTLGSAESVPETFPGKGSVKTVFPNHVLALCAETLVAGDSVVLAALTTEGKQQYRKFNPATDNPLLDEGICFVGGAAGDDGEFLIK